ncbi:MAG TPA: winged helix-turn-helix domain-containing protein [Terriglobales bacterium]|nr:winged helix-turn-helix domain-containing protein [Terriglobales bacterium]
MPAPSEARKKAGVARFGIFEVDLDAHELRKQGRRLRLQDQPFAVLVLLLERAGETVLREELRQKLWPADTFGDFDHSLNTAINKIREALGDSASSPRFVETLARRGYRFIADVRWEVHEDDRPVGLDAADQSRGTAIASMGFPAAHRGITRSLFALLQVMYLIFYLEALFHWQGVDRVSWADGRSPLVLVLVLVTAGVGIPVRLYLLSAAAFDYSRLGEKFRRIFIPLLVLDELWAVAPFLILDQIGFGAAFAATAALLYAPFAERTLIRMAYQR